MNYQHYSLDDFVMDDSFQQWVLRPDPASGTFWEEWLKQHPEKRETVEKARQIIRATALSRDELSDEEMHQVWNRVREKTAAAGDPVTDAPRRQASVQPLYRWPVWQKIAASLTGLLLVAAALWWFIPRNEMVLVSTGYGETREIQLPDSSTVVLNGNTRVRYAKHWSTSRPREVYLNGEAYFRVLKAVPGSGNAPFIVHASQLNVEVLGTEFNVSDRRRGTEVVLRSGSIQLDLSRDGHTGERLLMEPGERVLVSENTSLPTRQKVDPAKYASWINKKLILDNTSLQEVAAMLEETYGLQVRFQDPRQAEQQLAGEIPTDNLEVLLLTLSKASKLTIERNDDQVLFKR